MSKGFRIFEYFRKDKETGEVKYKTEIIVQDFDVICFGETKVPVNISEETTTAFLDEAEKAVLRQIDSDLTNKMGS